MAALQCIIELTHRRRCRSEMVYMNAFICTTFNPLEVLLDTAIIGRRHLTCAKIQELI